MDWVVTVPKTTSWSDYEQELKAVVDGDQIMNYRVHLFPKEMRVGDRCFVVHDGSVRGWMTIVGLVSSPKPWRCTTTGHVWPEGNYIQRSGVFHPMKGLEMKGFQGIRKFKLFD